MLEDTVKNKFGKPITGPFTSCSTILQVTILLSATLNQQTNDIMFSLHHQFKYILAKYCSGEYVKPNTFCGKAESLR